MKHLFVPYDIALKLKELDKIFSFQTKKEKIQFQEMVLSVDTMQEIQKLMNIHPVINSRKILAEKLKVSQLYLSKLWSGDEYVTIKFLNQIQDLFDVRFKIIIKTILTKN